MEYICSFTERKLCELIQNTKESLFICLPLLHPNVLAVISDLHQQMESKVSINIGIDFTPGTFRQGYGEIEAYEKMHNLGFKIYNMKDNRISFIISDNIGYFLFIESRYLIPADKHTLNAVKIDAISLIRLKHHFFHSYVNDKDFADKIANAFIDEHQKLKNIKTEFDNQTIIKPTEINMENLEEVQNDLKLNPPLKPDYHRIVEYYSNKFQYVRLEIVGANLRTKKIDLPTKALPIKDAELKKKLETKLNLFGDYADANFFKELDKFKNEVAKKREEFLVPLKCRKESILKKSRKKEFEEAVSVLKKNLEKVTNNKILELDKDIYNTKKKLEKDLYEFFIINKDMLSIKSKELIDNDEYIKMKAQNLVQEIINTIKWPDANDLLTVCKINTFFSDITYEDLKNMELIEELKQKGLIQSKELENLTDLGRSIDLK